MNTAVDDVAPVDDVAAPATQQDITPVTPEVVVRGGGVGRVPAGQTVEQTPVKKICGKA